MQTQSTKLILPLVFLIPITIFIEGFVSIGIEMLTIRQLLPLVGNSVVVTSLIIGIFLLFLALGYRNGGRISQNSSGKLRFNFTIASIWLGIGLSYLFVANFFNYIQKISGSHIIYPLIAYLLCILAPLIYILGQTIPITMNMVKQDKALGMIGGNMLGLSTLGSFLGAVLTTLLLMQYLGVAWTVYINFLLLIVLSLLFSESFTSVLNSFFIACVAMIVVYSLNITFERNYFSLTDNYANYLIADSSKYPKLQADEKILVINDAENSYINKMKKTFPYSELIKQIIFHDLKLRNKDILVLGAGGFSLSAENPFNNRFTYIDIDKQIKKVAIPNFLDHMEGRLIIDDARHYLHSAAEHYDVIIADAYTNVKYIPPHLVTREYMQSIWNRLSQKGIAILNIIAKPTLSDPYSKRIDNTIRSVFANCMSVPVNYWDAPTNVVYICFKGDNRLDKKIYTDNLNTSTTDSFEW